MKHEIIELHDVQIIGMAKKIAFNEAKEECPKFCPNINSRNPAGLPYIYNNIHPIIKKQGDNCLRFY